MYRDAYARAGYKMLSDFERNSRFTRAEIVAFTVILVLATLLRLADRRTPFHWAAMLLAGAFLLFHAVKLAGSESKALARQVVHATVLYLPVILGIMVTRKL